MFRKQAVLYSLTGIFFAELIITDVTVKHDMHVPSVAWLGASNQSASTLLYSSPPITCPKLPHTRQLLLLFLMCPHLVEKAGQSYFLVVHLSPEMTPQVCY